MNKAAAISGLVLLALAAYLAWWPVWIDPVAWTPGPDPGWTGPFAPDPAGPRFDTLETGPGPEDVAIGPDGLLYTGMRDGRIVRFDSALTRAEDFARTGGRPLGLQFAADGTLYVADRDRGLLSVSPAGTVTLLADSAGGRAIGFADDLDIARDGTVWFSDLTTRFPDDMPVDAWEGRATGRLLVFDPATATTAVHTDSLHFPNGVALGPGEDYVLVCELFAARVARIWLRGPRAGERDVFIAGLPGHPDNLSYDRDGVFWIALVGPRSASFERLAPRPFLRAAAMRIPGVAIPHPMPWRKAGEFSGCVIAVDTTGAVRRALHDPAGRYGAITSVNRRGGHLFLGSIAMTSVARVAAGAPAAHGE